VHAVDYCDPVQKLDGLELAYERSLQQCSKQQQQQLLFADSLAGSLASTSWRPLHDRPGGRFSVPSDRHTEARGICTVQHDSSFRLSASFDLRCRDKDGLVGEQTEIDHHR